jgi:hypothetical protein
VVTRFSHSLLRYGVTAPDGLTAVTRYTSPMKAAKSIRCPNACACVHKVQWRNLDVVRLVDRAAGLGNIG